LVTIYSIQELKMPTKNEISEFSMKIVEMAEEENLSVMDTIVAYCEKTGMEIDVASTLISSALKAKLREEAQELNLLKKSARLPI
jgi:O-phosphoseryl-tRNA(Cys) synthetase